MAWIYMSTIRLRQISKPRRIDRYEDAKVVVRLIAEAEEDRTTCNNLEVEDI
jgi:hypothetical protein